MPDELKSSDALQGVTSLTDIVRIQPNAVVSRTVLKKKSGTVTAFAFDEGEGLSEHTAPFDALVILIEGEAEVTIAGHPNRMLAGQILALPAGVPHALKALKPFKMLLVMIKD